MWTQIVGKIRMAKAPMINHWWQVTLYVTPRGLSTGTMPDGEGNFEIEFDFRAHELRITQAGGGERAVKLEPKTVAQFHAETFAALAELGIDVEIWPVPVEVEVSIPFAEDTRHDSYDPAAAELFWRQLVQADRVLTTFRSGFAGKVSPVHFFWGVLRHGRHPVLGPPRAGASRRRSQLRRLGDGRGLLARALELRLLARRERGGLLLRLRIPRARRLQLPPGQPSRGRLQPGRRPVPAAVRGGASRPGPGRNPAGVPADHLRGGRRPRRLGPRHARLLAGAGRPDGAGWGPQPSFPVEPRVAAPTGFDSGDPRCRRKIAITAKEPTARNSDCQFWSEASQKSAEPR